MRLVVREGVPVPIRRTRPSVPTLYWLGQAGFLIETEDARILIDPYLSDSLAVKYAGTEFSHVRLQTPPVLPDELQDIDLFCATHAHSDHLDPGTLPEIAAGNPFCRFVVPASCRETAILRGVPPERLVPIDAGDEVPIVAGVKVLALPSAHEKRERDAAGHERFLGYALALGRTTLYHSGDCVPYGGLGRKLARLPIDLALLPVNGRDAFRASQGIPGNFTINEAFGLAREAGIPFALAHHYGMFDFNTVALEEIRSYLGNTEEGRSGRFQAALVGVSYSLEA